MIVAMIHVTLKPGVNDPQGLAIRGGLHRLGFDAVRDVRAGKYLEVMLETEDAAAAQAQIERMCEQLLANPIIESYRFELESSSEP